MGQHIFISRSLSADSIFRNLERNGHKLTDRSLIQITPLDFKLERTYDLIFFYSKNAVKYFFDKVDYNPHQNYAAMGSGTNEAFKRYSKRDADLIGNGNAKETSLQLIKQFKDQSVLFPQASNSLKSVERIIEHVVKCDSIIVYKNEVTEIDLPRDLDILIFTSPLNVKSYFQQYSYKNQTLIAIGPSTKEALRQHTNVRIHSPESANMESLFMLCRTLL